MSAYEKFSTTLEAIAKPGVDPNVLVEGINSLVKLSLQLFQDTSFRLSVAEMENICAVSRLAASTTRSRSMRLAGLRLFRFYLRSPELIRCAACSAFDYFVVRSLEAPDAPSSSKERMEAMGIVLGAVSMLPLVDATVDVLEDVFSIPQVPYAQSNMRAVVRLPLSIASSLCAIGVNRKDKFRATAIRALCRLALIDTELLASVNGIRVVVSAAIDPALEHLQPLILRTITFLLDDGSRRQHFNPLAELRCLVAPLCDQYTPADPVAPVDLSTTDRARYRLALQAVIGLMRTWPGLIMLGGGEEQLGTRALVDALALPVEELQHSVLDALCDLFDVRPAGGPGPDPPVAKRSGNKADKVLGEEALRQASVRQETLKPPELPVRHRRAQLLDSYRAVLLVSFTSANLLPALVDLAARERHEEPTRALRARHKAVILAGDLLALGNRLLSPRQCVALHAMPQLIRLAAAFDERTQPRASTVVQSLSQYAAAQRRPKVDGLLFLRTGANKFRRRPGVDKKLDRVEEIKQRMDLATDAASFQLALEATRVTSAKSHTRWDWSLIEEIVDGALPAHIHSVLKSQSKWLRRLFSFWQPDPSDGGETVGSRAGPDRDIFARLPWTPDNLRYARVACKLVELLCIVSDEGKQFLADQPFLRALAQLLQDEVVKTFPVPDRVLAPVAVTSTMAREYFTVIGTLSATPRGVELMKKFGLWEMLKSLVQLEDREDLLRLVVMSLDYNMAGESHKLLASALTSPYRHVRYVTVEHMRSLLRAGIQAYDMWGIRMLVERLADPSEELRTLTVAVLDEALDDPECVEEVLKSDLLSARIQSLGAAGFDLQARLLSEPAGLTALTASGFVRAHTTAAAAVTVMRDYATSYSASLDEAFGARDDKARRAGLTMKAHFFGELCATKAGVEACEAALPNGVKFHPAALPSSSLPASLEAAARNVDGNHDPAARLAALLALCAIAGSPTGADFVDKNCASSVVDVALDLAQGSRTLSLRGAATVCLSLLVSKSRAAARRAEARGWASPSAKDLVFARRLPLLGREAAIDEKGGAGGAAGGAAGAGRDRERDRRRAGQRSSLSMLADGESSNEDESDEDNEVVAEGTRGDVDEEGDRRNGDSVAVAVCTPLSPASLFTLPPDTTHPPPHMPSQSTWQSTPLSFATVVESAVLTQLDAMLSLSPTKVIDIPTNSLTLSLLATVDSLANRIVREKSLRRLQLLRTADAGLFVSPLLAMLVLRISAVRTFPLDVRRTLHSLFDQAAFGLQEGGGGSDGDANLFGKAGLARSVFTLTESHYTAISNWRSTAADALMLASSSRTRGRAGTLGGADGMTRREQRALSRA